MERNLIFIMEQGSDDSFIYLSCVVTRRQKAFMFNFMTRVHAVRHGADGAGAP